MMDFRRYRLFYPLAIICAVWLVFGMSIWFGLIDLDDQEHILANPAVSRPSLDGIIAIWREPYFKLYIPMTYSAWAGISILSSQLKSIFGSQPFILFHAANVACHSITSVVVFFILRRLTQKHFASCAGALFFALHPLQVESVAWISGFKDSFSGMLSVFSIFFALRYSDSKRMIAGLASLVFFLSALFAKPTSIVTPLIWGALVLLEGQRKSSSTLKMLMALQVLLGGSVVIYTMAIQPAADLPFKLGLWERPFIAADALLFYLGKIVAPFRLGFDYGLDPEWMRQERSTVTSLLVVVAIGSLLLFRPSWRRFRLPAMIFVFGLLPTLGFIPYYYQAISTTADRYVYLALFGPGLLVAQLLAVIPAGRWPLFWRGVTVCLMSAYGCLCFFQVKRWQDTITIARHTIEVNPRSWLAHHVLGGALIKSGNLAQGATHLKQTTAMRPWFPDAYYNLGIVAKMTGQLEDAVSYFRATVKYEPKDNRAWHELASTLATIGRYDEATEAFDRALSISPTSGETLGEYGRLKIAQGDKERGVPLLEKAVLYGHRHPTVFAAWGEGLLSQGKDTEAIAPLREAYKLGNRDPAFLANYGLAHMRLGKLGDGIRVLEEAVTLDPNGFVILYNLGLAYEKNGDKDRARQALEQAIAIKADFAPAKKALQRILPQ
jgi:Flp pilus assembly protein TadD